MRCSLALLGLAALTLVTTGCTVYRSPNCNGGRDCINFCRGGGLAGGCGSSCDSSGCGSSGACSSGCGCDGGSCDSSGGRCSTGFQGQLGSRVMGGAGGNCCDSSCGCDSGSGCTTGCDSSAGCGTGCNGSTGCGQRGLLGGLFGGSSGCSDGSCGAGQCGGSGGRFGSGGILSGIGGGGSGCSDGSCGGGLLGGGNGFGNGGGFNAGSGGGYGGSQAYCDPGVRLAGGQEGGWASPIGSAMGGCGQFGCGTGGKLCLGCRLRGAFGLGQGAGLRGHMGGGLQGNHPYGGSIPHTDYLGACVQPQNGMTPTYAYPYYTLRGPRDFLQDSCAPNPIMPSGSKSSCVPSIGW
jgi:hypothetical protein